MSLPVLRQSRMPAPTSPDSALQLPVMESFRMKVLACSLFLALGSSSGALPAASGQQASRAPEGREFGVPGKAARGRVWFDRAADGGWQAFTSVSLDGRRFS